MFLASTVLFVLITFPLISSVGASLEMWSQTYGGTSIDSAEAMVQTSDGGYALAGYTTSFGAGGYDFWLVKTDGYGNLEWNQTYGGAGIEHAYALVETSDGGYAIAGGSLLVKTDTYGNLEWNQTCGGAAYSLVETSDGGFALAGETASFNVGNYDFWLVKTDANGNVEWNQTYGGAEPDRAYSLVETSDGGYAIAGNTNDDFWLLKTDEYGIPEFPSWIIMPLFMATTLSAVIVYTRLTKKASKS